MFNCIYLHLGLSLFRLMNHVHFGYILGNASWTVHQQWVTPSQAVLGSWNNKQTVLDSWNRQCHSSYKKKTTRMLKADHEEHSIVYKRKPFLRASGEHATAYGELLTEMASWPWRFLLATTNSKCFLHFPPFHDWPPCFQNVTATDHNTRVFHI